MVNKGTRGLWTQTGSTLEHVILWWCQTPLGTRPVACAKYLRDWLLNIQPDGKREGRITGIGVCLIQRVIRFYGLDTPEPILSILRGLGETLTVHVSCTTWDKQFRLTLVSSVLPIDYPFESDEFFCKKSEVTLLYFPAINSILFKVLIAVARHHNHRPPVERTLAHGHHIVQ